MIKHIASFKQRRVNMIPFLRLLRPDLTHKPAASFEPPNHFRCLTLQHTVHSNYRQGSIVLTLNGPYFDIVDAEAETGYSMDIRREGLDLEGFNKLTLGASEQQHSRHDCPLATNRQCCWPHSNLSLPKRWLSAQWLTHLNVSLSITTRKQRHFIFLTANNHQHTEVLYFYHCQ